MHKAWYILNYHDVSWEQNAYLNAVGDSFPPDVFEEQVATLAREFELVSIRDGWQRLQEGRIDTPLLSFWFDDGYLGVRRYAEPIMREYGVTGGIAVNSDFLLRRDFFWRLKLSYLVNVDGLRFLRPVLRKHGFKTGDSVREFTLNNANREIVDAIDELYLRFTTPAQREDAWRLFDTPDGIRELHERGWDISNHTCGHYPLLNNDARYSTEQQFRVCNHALIDSLDIDPLFWVLPFGKPFYDQTEFQTAFEAETADEKVMVYVHDRVNQRAELHGRQLFRITMRLMRGPELVRHLRTIPVHAA